MVYCFRSMDLQPAMEVERVQALKLVRKVRAATLRLFKSSVDFFKNPCSVQPFLSSMWINNLIF